METQKKKQSFPLLHFRPSTGTSEHTQHSSDKQARTHPLQTRNRTGRRFHKLVIYMCRRGSIIRRRPDSSPPGLGRPHESPRIYSSSVGPCGTCAGLFSLKHGRRRTSGNERQNITCSVVPSNWDERKPARRDRPSVHLNGPRVAGYHTGLECEHK